MHEHLKSEPAGAGHDHTFGQGAVRPGERRTIIVIVITATMMVVEIAAGIAFGSIALLADGLHMGSHTVALGITAFAYIYARRHADDARFSFGTGKVNALGGFTGAVLLAVFAAFMVWESANRLIAPTSISFNWAIAVAVVGLIVNAACALILASGGHSHDDDQRHDQSSRSHVEHHHHEDHNLRSAYLHVLADALTSILAIAALLSAKYAGLIWMDPVMGFVGAALVGRWSFGLIGMTSSVLLDHQASVPVRQRIRDAIESRDGDRVSDLHVWSIGPGIYAAEIAVSASAPRSPADYRKRLPADAGLAHVTIEVTARTSDTDDRA